MPQGLQVFDEQGRLVVDITDRLTRIIGSVYTGTTPGSIQVPQFSGTYGTPWAFVQQRNASANMFGKRCVRATISGTTLSWDFPGLTSWENNASNYSIWSVLMPAGLQVFNDDIILQIDEFHQNMVLTQKGSVTTARPGGAGVNPYQGAYHARIAYPVSSRQPVLAIRSTGNVCFLTDDTGFTIFSPNNGVVVNYYIYDRVNFGSAAGNVGMQVFNAQGVEVFNTNNNYMRVLGNYSRDIGPVNPTNGVPPPTWSGSVPVGKTVAVCMGVQSTGYYIEGVGTPTQPAAVIRYWQCQVVTPTANTFTLTNGVIQLFGGPIPARPGMEGAISSYNSGMLLDVTNV